MSDMNTLSIMGRLTKDVELKSSTAGKSFVNFSIACNDGFGEHTHTSFFNCVAFGKTADAIHQYLSKGSPIAITGKIKQETWESEGQRKSTVKIIVSQFHFVGSKKEESKQEEAQQEIFNDDSIPF